MRSQNIPFLRFWLKGVVCLLLTTGAALETVNALDVHWVASRSHGLVIDKNDLLSRKADAVLSKLVYEYEAHLSSNPGKIFKPKNTFIRYQRGRVLIDAYAESDGESLLSDLKRLGLEKSSHYRSVVSGYLPVGLVRSALQLGSLKVISASMPMTMAGTVNSQGDTSIEADTARTTLGVDGSGITVGVLSDSYGCNYGGGAADEYPGDMNLLADVCPNTDEGRAMMEIVHDLAPGAAGAFHTAFEGLGSFAQGIIDLKNIGAKVITDDVIYFSEPMFQDGVVAEAVNQVVAEGVAYFSSAGNSGRNSYESPYRDSNEMLMIQTCILPGFCLGEEYGGYLHDFDPNGGKDTNQGWNIPVGQGGLVCIQWDEPWGQADIDLDIYLLSAAGIVAAGNSNNNVTRGGSGQPFECMQYANDGSYGDDPLHEVLVTHYSSGPNQPGSENPYPEPNKIKYVILKSASAPGPFEWRTDSSTLFGHANATGAQAVGAAFYDLIEQSPVNCLNERVIPTGVISSEETVELECFSSAGGTPILFDVNNNPLAAPEVRQKPNIVAPDGVNNTFLGSDIEGFISDPDIYPNFFGTSAAGPHAAATAALMLQANQSLTPSVLYSVLHDTAVDMGDPGFDFDSGYGFIQAYDAVDAVVNMSPDNQPPVASFSYSCDVFNCEFNAAASSDVDGSISLYQWNFGDSSVDETSSTMTSHSYIADGQYTVSLNVIDNQGLSSSAYEQQVSINSGGGGTTATVHVGDIDGASISAQKGNWAAQVTVSVHNESEEAIPGYIVAGTWDGGVTGTGNCETDISGACTMISPDVPKNQNSEVFTVTNVCGPSNCPDPSYDSTSNHDPDGGNGTVIQVNKDGTTVSPGGTQNDTLPIHLHGLTGSSSLGKGTKWNATVLVEVHESLNETAVSAATVSGEWSGGVSGSGSCITDANGQCFISYNNIRNATQVTLTISGIDASGFNYEPSGNHGDNFINIDHP